MKTSISSKGTKTSVHSIGQYTYLKVIESKTKLLEHKTQDGQYSYFTIK